VDSRLQHNGVLDVRSLIEFPLEFGRQSVLLFKCTKSHLVCSGDVRLVTFLNLRHDVLMALLSDRFKRVSVNSASHDPPRSR
jgi:hypothetical protein